MDVNALKQHCRQISEEILEFLADRETSAPKVTPTPNPWPSGTPLGMKAYFQIVPIVYEWYREGNMPSQYQ